MKRILVLTSGGDAPGMNAAIRAITLAARVKGHIVYGAIGGYQGVIDNNIKELTASDVEGIINQGGTIIKSSRCPEFMTEVGFNKAVKNLKQNKIDYVVVLGGDGSLHGAQALMNVGINVLFLPCTIDNDLAYTKQTIGFDTALNTITSLLGNVRDTSASHDRVCVVEVMGRECGDLAVYSGMCSGAEVILVPEIKTERSSIMQKVKQSVNTGEKCVLVVVAEGYGTAESVRDEIKKALNIDAKAMNLGYVQRGGSPTVADRLVATIMGYKAVELICGNKSGFALCGAFNDVSKIEISKAINQKDKFDKTNYAINNIISV